MRLPPSACPIGRQGLPLLVEGSASEQLQAALRRHINKSREGGPSCLSLGRGRKGGSTTPETPLPGPLYPQPELPRLLPARFPPLWLRPLLTRPSLSSSPASLASPPFPGPSHPLASLTGRLQAATAPGSEAAVNELAARQGGRPVLPIPGLACLPPVGPVYRRPALLYNSRAEGGGGGLEPP